MKKYFIFIIIICGLVAFQANAQILSGDITMSANPQNPKTGETVRVNIASYSVDLNQAKISWLLNGSIAISAIGKKEFSFTANSSKSQIIVEAMIETINGSLINKKIVITPNDVDLLWEAYDAYVPPFYKGKALVPNEGMIKAVAIPNSGQILGYTYKWKQDENNKPNSSGYGKNYYVFKNSYLDNGNTVEVTVSDLFSNNIGTNKLSLKTNSPKILFYKKDLALGTLWEKSLENGYVMDQAGETIVAEPYFFSPKDLNSSNLSFSWLLNGEKIENPTPINTLSLKPESKTGGAEIKLVINNIKTLFQKGEGKINVQF